MIAFSPSPFSAEVMWTVASGESERICSAAFSETSLGKRSDLLSSTTASGPAAANEGEITFHPPQIEVGAGIGDDGNDVDIRADDLCLAAVSGHFPGKNRPARELGSDDMRPAFIAFLNGHPVTDSGQIGVHFRRVPQPSAEDAVDFLAALQKCGEVDGSFPDKPGGNPALFAKWR